MSSVGNRRRRIPAFGRPSNESRQSRHATLAVQAQDEIRHPIRDPCPEHGISKFGKFPNDGFRRDRVVGAASWRTRRKFELFAVDCGNRDARRDPTFDMKFRIGPLVGMDKHFGCLPQDRIVKKSMLVEPRRASFHAEQQHRHAVRQAELCVHKRLRILEAEVLGEVCQRADIDTFNVIGAQLI
ncbi:MAG: hypothetical protein OXQ89_15890 [Rhodospirillaceae bacterium]|nr:hypothetical protein [Rhodospirillaceae bacterium]